MKIFLAIVIVAVTLGLFYWSAGWIQLKGDNAGSLGFRANQLRSETSTSSASTSVAICSAAGLGVNVRVVCNSHADTGEWLHFGVDTASTSKGLFVGPKACLTFSGDNLYVGPIQGILNSPQVTAATISCTDY